MNGKVTSDGENFFDGWIVASNVFGSQRRRCLLGAQSPIPINAAQALRLLDVSRWNITRKFSEMIKEPYAKPHKEADLNIGHSRYRKFRSICCSGFCSVGVSSARSSRFVLM